MKASVIINHLLLTLLAALLLFLASPVHAQNTYQCTWDDTRQPPCQLQQSCASGNTVPDYYLGICESRGNESTCLIDEPGQCHTVPGIGQSACYWEQFGANPESGICVGVSNCTVNQFPPIECGRINSRTDCINAGVQTCQTSIPEGQYGCTWVSQSNICSPLSNCSDGTYPNQAVCGAYLDPTSCISAPSFQCTTTPPVTDDYYSCQWDDDNNECYVGLETCRFGNSVGTGCDGLDETACLQARSQVFTCQQNTCGQNAQDCCSRIPQCADGLICDVYGGDNICRTCGGDGQMCCDGTSCDNGLFCSQNAGSEPVCRQNGTECGGRGENCCGQTQTTDVCEPGLSCTFNRCTGCGGVGEECCPGDTCYFDLSCNQFGSRTFCSTVGCGDRGEQCCTSADSPPCFFGMSCQNDGTCNYEGQYVLETAFGPIPSRDPTALLSRVLTIATSLAGGVAFLYILFGGYIIMFSRGDPEKLQEGKLIISSSVSGLLFIIFSVFLLSILGVNILGIPGFG